MSIRAPIVTKDVITINVILIQAVRNVNLDNKTRTLNRARPVELLIKCDMISPKLIPI